MIHSLRCLGGVLGLMSLLAAPAAAQDPTFSFEASSVNGVKLQSGPSSEVTVSPGDEVVVEIFLRDWSKGGELIRAYQATLDRQGFSSGFQGTIQPVAYDETTRQRKDNKPNCFIDTTDQRYIFGGRQNFGITDTVSPDYRWMGALVDADECRIAKQDGAKYYCGSVKMKVSEDASGPFTIRFREEEWASSLRNPVNLPIMGLNFEPLVINVGKRVLRVVNSDPPDGAINARPLSLVGGRQAGGWDRVVLRCNADSDEANAEHFTLNDGTEAPPRIKRISTSGWLVTLELDRPVKPGVWTTITHVPSATGVRIGSLPGDVTGDGRMTTDDFRALLVTDDSDARLPAYRADLDGSGERDPGDALRLIDLLTQPGAFRAKLRP